MLDNIPKKDMLFLIGDWNVGNIEEKGVTGRFGLGEQNAAGERLIEFCIENELFISNTMFFQHKRRLYTWTSPDGKNRNQIDYILGRKRWKSAIQAVKTLPGADCGTDHELLHATIKVKLKKRRQQHAQARYDLTKITPNFTIELSNRFSCLESQGTSVEQLWQTTEDIIVDTSGKNIPKKERKRKSHWLS